RSAGRTASGSSPACCRSASRLGEPDASMSLGRQPAAGLGFNDKPFSASNVGPAAQGAGASLEAVCDAPLGEVVGRHLDEDTVTGEDTDAILAHLARRMGDDFVI